PAAEEAGREGGAHPPAGAGRRADEVDQGAGGVHRRRRRGPVQVGPLPVLSLGFSWRQPAPDAAAAAVCQGAFGAAQGAAHLGVPPSCPPWRPGVLPALAPRRPARLGAPASCPPRGLFALAASASSGLAASRPSAESHDRPRSVVPARRLASKRRRTITPASDVVGSGPWESCWSSRAWT